MCISLPLPGSSHLSSNLFWSIHIDNVCSKAKRLLGMLYRQFRYADSTSLQTLYKSVIIPQLGYGASVWDPYHVTYSNKLERVQEFAAKVITRNWIKSVAEVVDHLGWPRLVLRTRAAKLCLCKRIRDGDSLIPPSVFECHPSTTVRHSNSKPLFLPRVRHPGSFCVSVIPLWNSIPSQVQHISHSNSV